MLEFNNITITVSSSERELVSNFNFVLNKGDKIALISEEGNGKSTLLKLALSKPLPYLTVRGTTNSFNHAIGYLPQVMPPSRQQQSVMIYLQDHINDFYRRYGEFLKLLGQFQLDENIQSQLTIETLSGGEKIKLQLLVLVMNEPDIYLLDEPSNDLDLDSLEWLESFIQDLDAPVLFVSHDETLIQNCANGLIHLESTHRRQKAHHTISRLSYQDYIEERLHLIDKQFQQVKEERRQQAIRDMKIQKQFEKVQHDLRTITRQDPAGARLLKKKMKSVKSQQYRYEREDHQKTLKPDPEESINLHYQVTPFHRKKTILTITNEPLKIEQRTLVDSINLEVFGTERIGIVGRNGVGKTTLMKLIAQKLNNRDDIKVAMMPQNYKESFKQDDTPLTFLMADRHKETQDRTYTILGSLKFTEGEMHQNVFELSGGQMAKLFLAKMVLNGSNVLLLDEPTRNLSPLSNPQLRKMLADFGGCLIAISHDRLFLKEVCTKVYTLSSSGLISSN